MIELPIAVFNWTVKVRNGEGWVDLLCFVIKCYAMFGWVGGGGSRGAVVKGVEHISTNLKVNI